MEVKTSKPYKAVQGRINNIIGKRNQKRGHVTHTQIFARESVRRKVGTIAVVALAAIGLGDVLISGIEAVSHSKKGYELASDAGSEIKTCVTKGLAGCALSSSSESPVIVTTIAPAESSSSIIACADSETITYKGPADMPDVVVAELNPELTPEEVNDVLNGAFWDQNSPFNPNALQGMYDDGQNPIFIAPKACAPYGG